MQDICTRKLHFIGYRQITSKETNKKLLADKQNQAKRLSLTEP